jgi:hypothetical protein
MKKLRPAMGLTITPSTPATPVRRAMGWVPPDQIGEAGVRRSGGAAAARSCSGPGRTCRSPTWAVSGLLHPAPIWSCRVGTAQVTVRPPGSGGCPHGLPVVHRLRQVGQVDAGVSKEVLHGGDAKPVEHVVAVEKAVPAVAARLMTSTR